MSSGEEVTTETEGKTHENREMVTYQAVASEGREKVAMHQRMAYSCGEKTDMNQK